MSQTIAGETITLTTADGAQVEAKVEDASKSESIQAKVLRSSSDAYVAGQVYEFERKLLSA